MYRPFFAIFPIPPKVGDKVILKGKVKDNAEKISINFTIDLTQTPLYICYHFKTLFNVDRAIGVIQNYKAGECQWGSEFVSERTWIDGPGDEFHLEFIFSEYEILVYTESGYHYSFEYKSNLNDIKTLQIWDDLEYIESITFSYSK